MIQIMVMAMNQCNIPKKAPYVNIYGLLAAAGLKCVLFIFPDMQVLLPTKCVSLSFIFFLGKTFKCGASDIRRGWFPCI